MVTDERKEGQSYNDADNSSNFTAVEELKDTTLHNSAEHTFTTHRTQKIQTK